MTTSKTSRNKLRPATCLTVLWLTAAGLGCAANATSSAPPAITPNPADVPGYVQPVPQAVAKPPSEGSLWSDRGGLGKMFINAKARDIGDIVTVRIVETSSATNKATTKTGRKSSISAGLEQFFNAEKRFPSDQPFFNPFSAVKANLESDFDGSGTTARSGALNAFITTRIVDILPNGTLIIQGNREVRINHENQVITLTGLVRPRDISADNVVQSTYIADARITYSGSGVLNDRQQPGWLMRIMDTVWPF